MWSLGVPEAGSQILRPGICSFMARKGEMISVWNYDNSVEVPEVCVLNFFSPQNLSPAKGGRWGEWSSKQEHHGRS